MQQILITKEEQRAIKSLERLAKKWPKSLSLFSNSGSLEVFKDIDDSNYEVACILGIRNDGGDCVDDDGMVPLSEFKLEYE
jgi:hypothetical protein